MPVLVCLVLIAALATCPLLAEPPVTRPAAARGTTVVPDDFLRRWDPVTIFFERPLGPVPMAAAGEPEDDPGRFVELSPSHPGAYTWLDAGTLQFEPAEPWPPLARFTWRIAGGGASFVLATLMSPPRATVPAAGAEGLDPVEAITLTFAEPLPSEALAQGVTIEVRPLPGIGGGGAVWRNREDFEIKVMERGARSDPASYVLALAEPIPLGHRAGVHFRLALDDAETSFARLAFATAEPFRALAFGCPRNRYPVTPEGSRYTADQAIRCDPDGGVLVVDFSAEPHELGPLAGRNLLRLTPSVENLSYQVAGRRLEVRGDFARETPYRVSLVPTPIRDRQGRRLDLAAANELYLYFPSQPPYLHWLASGGIVERRGPQRVPLQGRGDERLDLRLHRIDPFDRSFWPFPERPLLVDEWQRPPGPGEEPSPFAELHSRVDADQLAEQVRALGSPPVSTLVDLPLRREGGSASFGLDLAEHLEAVSGEQRGGTYLVGLRRLDGSTGRSWMRLQATDLSLTTIEEPRRVVFAVTSLATGEPVASATVRVEGSVHPVGGEARWEVLYEGATDAFGRRAWEVPGKDSRRGVEVRRIVVEKAGDVLVLDAARPPEGYADNQWSESYGSWLQWTHEHLTWRGPQPERLGHVFTERPVYRPEEPVHIKGYLRGRREGRLTVINPPGFVVVDGPGDLEWRYPATVTPEGSFYHRFDEEKLPTGVYRATFETADDIHQQLGSVSFRKEAYRLPRFEVQLASPERVPLDREFQVDLAATYYAGGRVSQRPVRWRVTQFPYTWRPQRRGGFYYSSDGRFSRTGRFEPRPALAREDTTDEDGGASLLLNPALEATAQARTYVVEATVVGADDQTVTATRRVVGLPPFLLGLKVPRYLERARSVRPEVLVLGPDDELLAGQEVTVRLLHRQWHSHLRPSDFSDGVARYVTEVVDEKVSETTVVSTTEPLALELPLAAAGVYVVEIEAHDRLGRAQVVSVDLFAGGDEPVTWQKPTTAVFEIAPDKAAYRPGETAKLVLKSPFQQAEALMVVEAPEGNRYHWLPVRGGQAVFELPVLGTYTPRLPVHAVLMRGRLAGTRPVPGSSTDLGKPATLAATSWLTVEPVGNRVEVTLEYPSQALPGQEVEVGITLADPDGAPLPGEVTLWLVDQAVLALGKEQRLDPLPDFITPVASHLEVRDSRGLAFGFLPFAEMPGGGEGGERRGLLDRQTVRRNFQPVPFFDPAIRVDAGGETTVRVQLPDNLTNFKLRAKAASGPGRFGVGTGHLEVRLPVIVQPALPRFVRPGDRFVAAAVGRLVEGEGGPGRAEARFDGVILEGEPTRQLTWVPNRPHRLEFPVRVPTPALDATGRPERREVVFQVGVERLADGAGDAFEVKLPLRDDRRPIRRRVLEELGPGGSIELPAVGEAVRPGSYQRRILVSDQPALVRMAAGLSFLLEYPYGCTEQRVSRARAQLAMRRFRDALGQAGDDGELDRVVESTLGWIENVVQADGLTAYWPGSPGHVSLTAWVVEFMVEAKAAGYRVDEGVFTTLKSALDRALRSDYSGFIEGEAFAERTWALEALAAAGDFRAAYGAELARRSQYLDLEGVAGVVAAFDRAGEAGSPVVAALADELWDGLVFRLFQGEEVYGGLQQRRPRRSGLILPSETRSLAQTTRALARVERDDERLQRLVDALVNLGRGDGWGTTNANAAALLALSEVIGPAAGAGGPRQALAVELEGGGRRLEVGGGSPTAWMITDAPGAATLRRPASAPSEPLVVRAETTWIPAADGSQVAPRRDGFVVSRELLVQVEGEPAVKLPLEAPGTEVELAVGDVVEEHARVVCPADRHYVAVVVPLAAGMEPLNPNLATAPPEARPEGQLTLAPTYTAFLDDHVAFYYNTLPKGTYDFYFRTRATVPGRFIQPPALAEMMYDGAVIGTSAGAVVVVERGESE